MSEESLKIKTKHIYMSHSNQIIMNFYVAYCSSTDGMGDDITTTISLNSLQLMSKLPFNVVNAYSIHKQDDNLIQCVCDYLGIESIQLIYIELDN